MPAGLQPARQIITGAYAWGTWSLHPSQMSSWLLQVLEDVRGIIAEQLGTDLDKVNPDSKFVDLGADSLDTVEIMMALEEKFDLQLDEEGAEKISTVQVRPRRPLTTRQLRSDAPTWNPQPAAH